MSDKSTRGSGDITITGDGNVIGDNNQVNVQKGGIHARRIEAQNVVSGVMASPEALQHAGELVALARAVERGGISADTIKAQSVVDGVYIPSAHTVAELRQEVAKLREQVQAALAAGEIEAAGDAEDAAAALAAAEAELEKPKPGGGRVVRNLKTTADILTGAADVAVGAQKVGAAIIKLAPVAMMLWKLAETLF